MMFKVSAVVLFLSCAKEITSFAPTPSFSRATLNSNLKMIDPSMFHDLPQHFDSIGSAFSSLMISDGDISAAVDAVDAVTTAATDAVTTAAVSAPVDTVTQAASTDQGGGLGFLTGPIEGLLETIHSLIVAVGMDANAWGVSIVALTVLIKVLTYPLNKQQLESNAKMQMLQPAIKQAQAKYASNPEIMNQKVAEIYQSNDVNPLAGCLPLFIQLPVFIGLYRAVSTLAKDNELNEPFLWLPNLEGPIYGADPAEASNWLFSGWVDGVPSLGWDDTLAFLSIPVILIATQYLSIQLTQPKNVTPEQEAAQNNIVLKLLPLMLGFFSISVPAALGVYWVSNNIITTLLTIQIRSSLDATPPALSTDGSATARAIDTPVATFTPAPLREKPAGFAAAVEDDIDGIKPITPMDAEVVEASVEDAIPSAPSKKKRKGKKKKRN